MKHFPALLTTLLLSPVAALHASDASNPNSIVILANDMSYPDAGFDDCKDILTPDLDSIAKRGIRVSVLMQWPGAIKPGQTVDTPVSSRDLIKAKQASRPNAPDKTK